MKKKRDFADKFEIIYSAPIKNNPNFTFVKKVLSDVLNRILFDDKSSSGDKTKLKLINSASNKNIKVYKCTVDNLGEIYLKRYDYDRKLYRLKESVFEPEGLSQLKKSSKLNKLDIPAILPIASAVKRNSFADYTSVFISRAVQNCRDCSELINEGIPEAARNNMKDILRQFGLIWARLLNNNIIHKDPGTSNFLLENWRDNPRVVLVDLDDIFNLPAAPELAKIHALARFKGKFLNKFYKNSLEYREEWDDIFMSSFWEIYETRRKKDKFCQKTNRLAQKKFDWRKKRAQK